MHPPLSRAHPIFPLLLALFAAFPAISSSSAATLRVPQDFDRIQRAIHAAEAGDTILIAEGTFTENLVVYDRIVLQGAGVGKTVVIAPNREIAIVSGFFDEPIALRDLTLQHAPSPPPEVLEPGQAEAAVQFANNQVVFKNVNIENSAGGAVRLVGAHVTWENVAIKGCNQDVLWLKQTRPGSRFVDCAFEQPRWGYILLVADGAAQFTNLNVPIVPRKIAIRGSISQVRFEATPLEVVNSIAWNDGASLAGPSADELEAFEKDRLAALKEVDPSQAALRKDLAKLISQRRPLARQLQKDLRSANDAAAATSALSAYLEKLYPLQLPDDMNDDTLHPLVRGELRAFADRFGAAALAEAMRQLSVPHPDLVPEKYYTSLLSFDLNEAIESTKAETSLRRDFADVAELVRSWNTAGQTPPPAGAQAFVAMLRSVTKRCTAASDRIKAHVRRDALTQLPLFIERHGHDALYELVRQLSQSNDLICTAEQLRESLTREQRTAFIRSFARS